MEKKINQPTPQDKETPSSSSSPTNAQSSTLNPYPTTFVQADTSSFKQVVQMLTGSAETAATAAHNSPQPKNPIPAKSTGPKKPAFKLYERRNSLKNLNIISPLMPTTFHHPTASFSPRKQPEILSPSILDFPSLLLSPVTPLIPDLFNRTAAGSAMSAEEKAIAEKGFYLHPSPRSSGNKDAEPPRLLPLFPVTSPRSGSSECKRRN